MELVAQPLTEAWRYDTLLALAVQAAANRCWLMEPESELQQERLHVGIAASRSYLCLQPALEANHSQRSPRPIPQDDRLAACRTSERVHQGANF